MVRARAMWLLALLVLLLPIGPAAIAQSDPPEVDPLAGEAGALLDNIAALRAEFDELSARLEGLEGEERAAVELRMRKRRLEVMSELDSLVANAPAFSIDPAVQEEIARIAANAGLEVFQTFFLTAAIVCAMAVIPVWLMSRRPR